MNGTGLTCRIGALLAVLAIAAWVVTGALAGPAGASGATGVLRIAGDDEEWRGYQLVSGTVHEGELFACSTEGLMNEAFWGQADISGAGKGAAEQLAQRMTEDDRGTHVARLGRAAADAGAPYTAISGERAQGGLELESGYWLLASDTSEPMLVLVGGEPLELAPKSVTPTVRKQVKGASGKWGEVDEAGCGQKVRYRITAGLPSGARAYDELPFEVVDETPRGLDIDMGSVRVEARALGGARRDITDGCMVVLSKGELRVDVGRGNAFAAISRDPDVTQVVVSYTARVAGGAAAGVRVGNPNTAHIEYRSSSTSKSTVRSELVRAQLYTWKLCVSKTGAGSPLSGAEFELRRADGTVAGRAVTAEDGHVEFPSVSSGSFELIETRAPRGFLRAAATKVELRAELGQDGSPAGLSAQAEGAGRLVSCDAESGVVTVGIDDSRAPIPELGTRQRPGGPVGTGDGVSVAPALAIALAALAVGGLAHRARRRKTENGR